MMMMRNINFETGLVEEEEKEAISEISRKGRLPILIEDER
jgi:hypothetical protein